MVTADVNPAYAYIAKDLVEVVRCRECVHYKEVCGKYVCFHPKMESGWESEGGEHLEMKPTDFCSYGERRQNEQ